MNEENANSMNQNVAAPVQAEAPVQPVEPAPAPVAEVTPAAAPVAETPVQPVQPVAEVAPAAQPAQPVEPAQAPVAEVAPAAAPVAETPVQPVQPVQPVEPAPAPIAPAPVQPVQQPVQPAVPVQPVPVQQPVGGVPVYAPEQPPKKSNVGFIVIVIVLVLAIIGLVVAFFLNNNKNNDTKKDDVKTEEKQPEEKKEDPETPETPEEPELNKPEPVANANVFKAGDYTVDVPTGFELYSYTNGVSILVDKTNKIEMRVLILPNVSVDVAISEKESIKNDLISAGAGVTTDETITIGTDKWLIFNISLQSVPGVMGIGNIGTADAVGVYIFSYGTKDAKTVLNEVAPTLAAGKKTGSSFADAKASYKIDSFKYFRKDIVE